MYILTGEAYTGGQLVITLDEALQSAVDENTVKAYQEGYDAGIKDAWEAAREILCEFTKSTMTDEMGFPDYGSYTPFMNSEYGYAISVIANASPELAVRLVKNYNSTSE